MKTMRRYLFGALALALLAPCFVGPAKAQGPAQKFTLPFEARWGLATLQAGDYSFTVDHIGTYGMLRLYSGRKAVAMILAQGYQAKTSRRCALLVVQAGGTSAVREVWLPDAGVVLYCGAPHVRQGSAAEERQVSQLIQMTPAGAGQ